MKTSRGNTKVRGRGGGTPWGTALKSRLCSPQSAHTECRCPRRGCGVQRNPCQSRYSARGPRPVEVQCQSTEERGEAVERSCHLCARSPCFVPPVASLTGPNATCSTSRDAGEESGIKLGLGKWEERCSKVFHLVSRYTNQ